MTEQIDSYRHTAEFYDDVPAYETRPDVEFFVSAAVEAGGPVLEIGCGTGRVLIPTARAGVVITGLDLSTAMLDICRDRLAAEAPAVRKRVQLVNGDMRDFALGRKFALVTLPFRPFQHLLSVADQLSCLRTVRKHLRPDGRLILDIFNPSLPVIANREICVEFVEGPETELADGRRLQRKYKIAAHDLHRQINQIELIYEITHPDGRAERHVHAFPMRYLFRYEAEHLLVRAGFAVEALYADYERRPYGEIYPGELIFVAQPA